MKTLYLECAMGAAGDMLTAALLELLPDREAFVRRMNEVGLPGVRFTAEPSVKCGLVGTHVRVSVHGEEERPGDVCEPHHDHDHDHDHGHDHGHDHDHDHGHDHDHDHNHEHHHHASLADIGTVIDGLAVSERVKSDARAVYSLIAGAESRVHGRPVSEVHFHEVGALDAVADVVAVCMLMEILAPDRVLVSPVHVGAGHVRCAHGMLPVPAPATALLLEGVPIYGGQVQGELCTPTGAALLRHFADAFGDRPVMVTRAVGCGMGQKDFERANCVRAFLGESAARREAIVRLECNLDDMTGEALGFAMERLLDGGARDVYTTPIGMKKSRPGVMLSCVCLPEDADALAALMLKHTTTLGVRRISCDRYVLDRSVRTVGTPFGPVRVKRGEGFGVAREKPEYEDVAAVARENGWSLQETRDQLRAALDAQQPDP